MPERGNTRPAAVRTRACTGPRDAHHLDRRNRTLRARVGALRRLQRARPMTIHITHRAIHANGVPKPDRLRDSPRGAPLFWFGLVCAWVRSRCKRGAWARVAWATGGTRLEATHVKDNTQSKSSISSKETTPARHLDPDREWGFSFPFSVLIASGAVHKRERGGGDFTPPRPPASAFYTRTHAPRHRPHLPSHPKSATRMPFHRLPSPRQPRLQALVPPATGRLGVPRTTDRGRTRGLRAAAEGTPPRVVVW